MVITTSLNERAKLWIAHRDTEVSQLPKWLRQRILELHPDLLDDKEMTADLNLRTLNTFRRKSGRLEIPSHPSTKPTVAVHDERANVDNPHRFTRDTLTPKTAILEKGAADTVSDDRAVPMKKATKYHIDARSTLPKGSVVGPKAFSPAEYCKLCIMDGNPIYIDLPQDKEYRETLHESCLDRWLQEIADGSR